MLKEVSDLQLEDKTKRLRQTYFKANYKERTRKTTYYYALYDALNLQLEDVGLVGLASRFIICELNLFKKQKIG